MDMQQDREGEEYKFTEEQSSNVYQAPSPNKNPMEKIGRQAIFTLIGVLFGLYFLYRMISSFFGGTPPKKVPTPPPQPTPVVQPAPPPPPPPPLGLDEESKARISKVEDEVIQLQATASSLQDQVATNNNLLQQLSNQIKQTQDQIIALQPKPKPIVVHRKVVREVARPQYFIKALVPGRAWLMDQSGATLTLSVGDQLPGYGVINEIDTTQGAITTSTGDIIRFRPDDS